MNTHTPIPQFQDDRTEEQKKTHHVLWGGTDSFLSGWDCIGKRKSYAFWACQYKYAHKVERWVRKRDDMRAVRQVGSGYRAPNAVVHIYVVGDGHPALGAHQ